ncbi:MAG TPA: condensation domain-containing protein, partial [Candidatus Kapabacteria bacterium]|nr:condensation domain-containing protein [Candidatus Kapabacteria bacterium]
MEKFDSKNIENILALTPLQEGLLFHYLKDPQDGLYFEQLSLELTGPVDRRYFEKAWNVVIETNEMLRTVFRWEKLERPSQLILKVHRCRILFYDLTDKVERLRKVVLAEIKEKDRHENFDLHGVPFRVILCKLAESKYEMVISNHHIIYDGW